MSVKLLAEHHLEFLRLTGDCTGSSESALVKMPHCWKSHVAAQMNLIHQKHGHQGARLILAKVTINFFSSATPDKNLNNLAFFFKKKIALTNLMRRETWPPGGMVSLAYKKNL